MAYLRVFRTKGRRYKKKDMNDDLWLVVIAFIIPFFCLAIIGLSMLLINSLL